MAETRLILGLELSPEALDELWAILLSEDPDDPNPAINLVWLAFGQLLVERLGLSWVALTDANGTEIAVHGRSDFTVFPTNFIAKRYESRQTGFIAPAFDERVRTAESLASASRATGLRHLEGV